MNLPVKFIPLLYHRVKEDMATDKERVLKDLSGKVCLAGGVAAGLSSN